MADPIIAALSGAGGALSGITVAFIAVRERLSKVENKIVGREVCEKIRSKCTEQHDNYNRRLDEGNARFGKIETRAEETRTCLGQIKITLARMEQKLENMDDKIGELKKNG